MLFQGTAYITPLLGAYLADARWGRYKTILSFSAVYCVVSSHRPPSTSTSTPPPPSRYTAPPPAFHLPAHDCHQCILLMRHVMMKPPATGRAAGNVVHGGTGGDPGSQAIGSK